MAVFPSRLASSKAAGVKGIRVSRVKHDLHLEQLDARGQKIIGFVMHPIIKANKVMAVEFVRMGASGTHSLLAAAERAALAVITDELSQFKGEAGCSDAPTVIYF
jgi:hypothetical protein